jgi:PKD repeat protein
MLTLPPKLKSALDRGDFEPVVVAKLTTAVLDAPPAQQTRNHYRTVTDADNVTTLQYPAQGGDPVQTEALVYQGFTDQRAGIYISYILLNRGGGRGGGGSSSISLPNPQTDWIYQTFHVGEDIYQANRLKSVSMTLSRVKGQGWELRCRIYRVDDNGNLVDPLGRAGVAGLFGAGVESATVIPFTSIQEFPNKGNVTFNFDLDLISGARYAVLLQALFVGPGTHEKNLTWYGSEGGGGIEVNRGWSEGFFGEFSGALSLQVNVAAYTDPANTGNPETDDPWVDVSIDMNGTPVEAGFISLLDFRPTWFDPISGTVKITDIAYNLWAGATLGAKTTDLGAVVDGSAVNTLSRYYVLRVKPITANTTTRIRTPAFKKVNLVFAQVFAGAPKSYLISSGSFPGAIPAIAKIPSFPTRLDPRNHLTQRAAWRLALTDPNGEITRILTEAHLLNLPIELYFGHRPDAASLDDLAPMGAGKIVDYAYNEGRPELVIEDRTKDLSVKIPKPTSGSLQRRDYRFKQLVDVLEEIEANEVEISRRWIETSTFAEHKTYLKGADAVSKWITDRVVTEPEEADKTVKEILQIIGAHQTTLEDGKLRLIRFPKSGNSVRTWDRQILSVEESQSEGFARTLVNQCLVSFKLDSGGENLGIALYLDDDAQNEWAPGAERFRADRTIEAEKWLGQEDPFFGKTVAERVAAREVRTHKNGMVPKKCRTALTEYEIQVGDLLDVTSPVFLKRFELGSTAKQFQVTAKDPRIEAGEIDWELVEAIQVNRPPTAIFTVNVAAGTPPFTVNFNGTGSVDPDGTIVSYEWDFDYDGVNFTVDATGSTTSHEYDSSAAGVKLAAHRVTDDAGVFHISTKVIRVRKAPTARIVYDISAPDQPLFAVVRSASVEGTGKIVKVEWDLSYDGVTFNAELVGETATINLPYQSVTVALLVTDEDGLTDIETITLEGKAFAPADVTGFFVDQVSDKLIFHWNVNPETDLYGYEIRRGSTWNTSILVADEVLTNSFTTVAPTIAGAYTFLVKAINTTGRRSINATAITMTVFDTKDRNVLVEVDRKAAGWPGTKTGLVYEAAGDRWWIASSGDLVSDMTTPVSGMTTPVALRGTRTSGTYEGPAIDLGGIVEGNRLSIPISTELTPDPEGVSAKVEYSESDDGSGYSAFAQISQSDLGFRYTKEKITLSNDDGASNIALQDVDVIIDVPDVDDSDNDEVIPVGGKVVNFNRVFNAVPAITAITIQNMTVSLYAKVTAKTKTGFTVQIFRASDNEDVGATIDWAAKGY